MRLATLRSFLLLAVAAGALAACAAIVDTRGNLAPADAVAAIKPGVTTRAQVSQLLGSPSSIATFDKNTWYYIGYKTERIAFLNPEVTAEQVLVIRFDDAGVVKDFEKQGLESARQVAMNDRETPTAGHSLGFFEQLFGNIGRFTGKDNEKKSSDQGGGGTFSRSGGGGGGF
ncbi:MAG TPA: outer membrane protein assembly factor BamE [Candidatus Sulfotelmatobacter sp.]|nr:outer membrane protein assembly factor BamE [Candidatus Sulfotelmatobacter sp.]